MIRRIVLEEDRHYTHSIEITATDGEIEIRAIEDEDGQPPRHHTIGFPAAFRAQVAMALLAVRELA